MSSVAKYSSAQFCAASRVPYIDIMSLPTRPPSPDLGSSLGSLMNVGRTAVAYTYSRLTSTYNTLLSLPYDAIESNNLKHSVGGVAATSSGRISTLNSFATSLDL